MGLLNKEWEVPNFHKQAEQQTAMHSYILGGVFKPGGLGGEGAG